MRFWLCLVASFAVLIGTARAGERAFVAIEVADMAVSAEWYASTFDVAEVRRFEYPDAQQRLLVGKDLIVELVARKSARASEPGNWRGLLKAGFQLADFDAHVARWRAQGVRFPGQKETIYDSALNLHSRLLLDPDGNIIQVFGTSDTLPR